MSEARESDFIAALDRLVGELKGQLKESSANSREEVRRVGDKIDAIASEMRGDISKLGREIEGQSVGLKGHAKADELMWERLIAAIDDAKVDRRAIWAAIFAAGVGGSALTKGLEVLLR